MIETKEVDLYNYPSNDKVYKKMHENNHQCYSRMQKAVSAARNIKNYMR